MQKLLVSGAPHVHSKDSTRRIMRDVIIALVPSTLVAFYFAGLWAVLIFAVCVISCVLTEYLITRYITHTHSSIGDLSAVVTGLLLALNLPPAIPWWIAVIGSIVAIAVVKMTFGGLGNNLFNPALVGRVFLLISFPVQMTTWTYKSGLFSHGAHMASTLPDALSGATPLGIIKEGLARGISIDTLASQFDFSFFQMLFGRIGGSVGEASAVAILIGFVYLLCRRVIKPHITLSIWGTVFVLGGALWLANPQEYVDPLFHLLTGGILLGSVFMATDYVTSPMTPWGQVVYGIGIGVITLAIRLFGSYPEGVSFAILIMNACTPLINKLCAPKSYCPAEKEVHHG